MQNRIRKAGLTALLLLSGISLVWSYKNSQGRDDMRAAQYRQSAQQQSELDELRREIREARAVTIALQPRPTVTPSAVPSARPDASNDVVPANAESAAVPPPRKELTFQDVRDGLSARLYAESYDPSWSAAARKRIEERLSAALPGGSRLVSVDCRSSICRAEVSQPDFDAHRKFVQAAFADPSVSWEGPTMVTLGEEPGSRMVTSVAFLAREGRDLTVETDEGNP